jgi:hypothetical protein
MQKFKMSVEKMQKFKIDRWKDAKIQNCQLKRYKNSKLSVKKMQKFEIVSWKMQKFTIDS